MIKTQVFDLEEIVDDETCSILYKILLYGGSPSNFIKIFQAIDKITKDRGFENCLINMLEPTNDGYLTNITIECSCEETNEDLKKRLEVSKLELEKELNQIRKQLESSKKSEKTIEKKLKQLESQLSKTVKALE